MLFKSSIESPLLFVTVMSPKERSECNYSSSYGTYCDVKMVEV